MAHEEALYWRLKREALVTELLAKGADVSEEYSASTAKRPLNSGALAAQIHVDEGERKVLNGYAVFIFCHKLIFSNIFLSKFIHFLKFYLFVLKSLALLALKMVWIPFLQFCCT